MDTIDLPSQARRRPHATRTIALETLLGLPGHGLIHATHAPADPPTPDEVDATTPHPHAATHLR